MKNFLFIKSIPILAMGLLGLQSTDSQPANSPLQVSVCLPKPESGSQKQEPVYSTRTLLFKDGVSEGCYTMQFSVYATYPNGQVLLAHTAVIKSGQGCKAEGTILNSRTFSAKSGPEYIVKDEKLNGSIVDFIAKHEDLYQPFVSDKEKIMGIK